MKTLVACLITALIVSVSASWAQKAITWPGKGGPVRGKVVCKFQPITSPYTISRAK